MYRKSFINTLNVKNNSREESTPKKKNTQVNAGYLSRYLDVIWEAVSTLIGHTAAFMYIVCNYCENCFSDRQTGIKGWLHAVNYSNVLNRHIVFKIFSSICHLELKT